MTKTNDKVTLQDIQSASERLKNWGRWGADDEAGTLNNISRTTSSTRRGSSAKERCFRWR